MPSRSTRNRAESMVSDATEETPAPPTPLGPSRIVWAFRVGSPAPMAIGKLFVLRAPGSPLHLLVPRRRLAPGRYDLMFARYGVRWPVALTNAASGSTHMIVAGRVPL